MSPSLGDIWHVGQSLYKDTVYGPLLDRCFAIAAYGASVYTPRLYIQPSGRVVVPDSGSLYSPEIDTPTMKINGTNISVLYQSKADMTNYITSGSLTNYVSITSNQTLTGKKTFTLRYQY